MSGRPINGNAVWYEELTYDEKKTVAWIESLLERCNNVRWTLQRARRKLRKRAFRRHYSKIGAYHGKTT